MRHHSGAHAPSLLRARKPKLRTCKPLPALRVTAGGKVSPPSSRPTGSRRALGGRSVAIMQALLEWLPAGSQTLPRQAQTVVAEQFGVTRQCIQQNAARLGLTSSRELSADAVGVYLACGSCLTRPVRYWRTGGVLCTECKNRVPVACDYCGTITYKSEAQYLNNVLQGKGLTHSGANQCASAAKKRCLRGPAAYVLQLGTDWQKIWINSSKYSMAARQAARGRGFRVEQSMDGLGGRSMRRVEPDAVLR